MRWILPLIVALLFAGCLSQAPQKPNDLVIESPTGANNTTFTSNLSISDSNFSISMNLTEFQELKQLGLIPSNSTFALGENYTVNRTFIDYGDCETNQGIKAHLTLKVACP